MIGPYVDKGMAYTDSNGKGHNVTGSMLPDGTWTVIVSDTRPGDIFTSSSIDGPWAFKGSITVNANGMDSSGTAKNLSLMILPDKTYLMATRFGTMMTTPSNLLGPWTVQAAKVFITPAGYPSGSREDPVIWCSGGQYHMVYNYYDLRKARHMVSPDGIKNWKDLGIAYDPTTSFIRYTDGTVNHWYKLERAGVFMENGHVSAFTFAAIDVDKASELGNDTHGSKVIVVPFDGATFDADTGVAGNACSTYSANSGVPGTGTGGAGGAGGTTGAGGATGSGGTTGTVVRDAGPGDGAVPKDAGAAGAGGGIASGGTVVTGGTTASGGTTAAGGNTAVAGMMATGGNSASGGMTETGGNSAAAANTATGGNSAAAGSIAVGSTGGTIPVTGGTTPTSTSGAAATGGQPAMASTAPLSSGGFVASTGTSATPVTNASSSSGCTFAPGPGARHPMSIAWAFAFACGLAWLVRSRRRR
jgi:hypothetical protein